MRPNRRESNLLAETLATLAMLTLVGCGQPRVSPGLGVELPKKAIHSAALKNGEVLEFDSFGSGMWDPAGIDVTKNAHIHGNELVGYVSGRSVAINLEDVKEIRYRGTDYLGKVVFTTVLVGTLALIGWLLWFLV